ncbi:thioredoxin family protein [Vagococcus fessus]|uniref:Thiol reductase thioredoxin n=1 Tax=Vagococcus fessus TaxID=120370 RepID=A0A430A877_9ENTE|nr:thioredoxin family protein [Vagococcus fessus]RSU03318.1 thiol reductase thioredoxin [Vagococcus fessus]
MIIPTSYEELANYVENDNCVFFFTAEWCGDCVFIKPVMPEISEMYPDYKFIQVDRDEFIDLCGEWAIFGIPSFVVTSKGKEVARLVNKERKTKEQVITFLNDAIK